MAPIILNIDTSGAGTSVCLQKGDIILSSSENFSGVGSSNNLFHLIDEVLYIQNTRLNEINAVSVCLGPGSYTGLRVGLSAGKGLAFGLGIPLLGVNSLKCMARSYFSQNTENQHCLVAIDARRDEVFAALFDRSLQAMIPPGPLTVDSNFGQKISKYGHLHCIGNGAKKISLLPGLPSGFKFDAEVKMRSVYMPADSKDRYLAGKFLDLRTAVPDYLKEFYSKNFGLKQLL